MSIHISAKKGQIAKVVIMPGDPLRAKWIAENYLTNPMLINNTRGMYGYTGKYKNTKITVMGHGMGIPSILIYTHELYAEYGVNCIIRIGTCGSYDKSYNVGDIFVAKTIYGDTNLKRDLGLKTNSKVLKVKKELVDLISSVAKKQKTQFLSGQVYSSNIFYSAVDWKKRKQETKSTCVEMEGYGLIANALRFNKDAAMILTCSDSFVNKKILTSKERETNLRKMVSLALESAVIYSKRKK